MQERALLYLNKKYSKNHVYFTTAGYLTVNLGDKEERYLEEIKDRLFFVQCERCKN
jgi:hypothetical protein